MRADELDVLFCDNHLLCVRKPAGLPTVPDESGDPSLFDLAREWIEREFQKPGRAFLGVVQRLDRPVSGAIVFARTSKAADRLTSALREKRMFKRYWAVCAGRPPAGEDGDDEGGRVDQWLWKDSSRNRVHVVSEEREGAKHAETRWRLLARRGGRSLVELEPITGRSHQLRVAMASLGCPLLGDLKYGAPEPLADKSVALHARELVVPHPTRAERIRVVARLPRADCWDFPGLHEEEGV